MATLAPALTDPMLQPLTVLMALGKIRMLRRLSLAEATIHGNGARLDGHYEQWCFRGCCVRYKDFLLGRIIRDQLIPVWLCERCSRLGLWCCTGLALQSSCLAKTQAQAKKYNCQQFHRTSLARITWNRTASRLCDIWQPNHRVINSNSA